jgi:hypothetical protein
LTAIPGRIYELVNQIVLPNFDFELMSRWVLGRAWQQATPEQRRQFADEFRTLLVRTYAKALLEYADRNIRKPAATTGQRRAMKPPSRPKSTQNRPTHPDQLQHASRPQGLESLRCHGGWRQPSHQLSQHLRQQIRTRVWMP